LPGAGAITSRRRLDGFFHGIWRNLRRPLRLGGPESPGVCNYASHSVLEQPSVPWSEALRYLIRDQDGIYGAAVRRRLRAMGIRDKPIAPGSPLQNGYAERLIGTIRRECLDHLIVFGEAHLRRILGEYAAYYNGVRTHQGLNQDTPVHRAVQSIGAISSRPILGGLHHHYCRI